MPSDGAPTDLGGVPRQMIDPPIVMRTERDMLGEREVPDCVLYGIHTLRAIENFNTGHPPVGHFPTFVQALGAVKAASALSNLEFGALNAGIVAPVVAACEELERGNWLDHFPVEIVQGGAGTSTNMNANEVIANRALDILGAARGDYERISPLEHVNKSQSTNDVYPTALRVALVREVDTLEEALEHLAVAFDGRAAQAEGVIKLGRTQLQDAVPIRFTRELAAHASTLRQERRQLQRAREGLTVINLGGTAVGNSVATPHGYAQLASEHLAVRTGVAVETAPDLVQATIDTRAASQSLKRAEVTGCSADPYRIRHAPSELRTYRRTQRTVSPAASSGIEHHARQGQPGHPRACKPGLLSGRGARRHCLLGMCIRAVPTKCLSACHRARPVPKSPDPDLRLRLSG